MRLDVRGASADLETVAALARLQLAARRAGERLVLCGASEDLLALIAFLGLAEILPVAEPG